MLDSDECVSVCSGYTTEDESPSKGEESAKPKSKRGREKIKDVAAPEMNDSRYAITLRSRVKKQEAKKGKPPRLLATWGFNNPFHVIDTAEGVLKDIAFVDDPKTEE